MTKTDFAFALIQYSLVLIAVGLVLGMFLRWIDDGIPKSDKWWPVPVIITCFSWLVIVSVVQFVVFVKKFGG